MKYIKNILKKLLIFLATVYLLFEELFWFAFNPFKLWISSLRIIQRLENFLHSLSPYSVLPVFLIPAWVMLFFKLVAIRFIAWWHIIFWTIAFLWIKVVGFFITSFIFNIVKNQILTIKAFAYIYEKFMIVSNYLHTQLEEMKIFLFIRKLKIRIRLIKNKIKIRIVKFFKRYRI